MYFNSDVQIVIECQIGPIALNKGNENNSSDLIYAECN
jgi:hypothetical protein